MKPWWQVVTPHRDVQEGKLSEAIFAADLRDVVLGKGPKEYQDARLFFQHTYITKGIEDLVTGVLTRIGGQGEGDAVIQLQTPFGGGKTHSLLSLYHIVKHFEEVKDIDGVSSFLAKADVKNLEDVRVASFVGTHADVIKGRTPWGEIAHQLDCYDLVKEHDIKRISPGKERINEILSRQKGVLILIDELLEYIVKANRKEKVDKITMGQTLAFLQELSEAVAASERSVLVLTLPASILEQYDEEAEKSLTQLQKVSGRVESIYTPVEGVEIYEIIRKRLFEDLGDRSVHKKVAENYFNLYQRLGNDAPSEVKEVSYRDKIERAYPFHPEFIDVLYERWSSYPTFQRTRGVLRLTAEVVADLYKRKIYSSLIHSSLVNLGCSSIRGEFIKHIENQFESVIGSDIDFAGKSAKAPQIDKNMGGEYERFGIAKGIATSVFLYSFSGGKRQGITLPRLRVALLRDDMPPTIVGDAVKKLEEELWFFHSEGNLYSFKNYPNINRVIVDREETISDHIIEEALKEKIGKIAGSELEAYLWPNDTADVPDNKNLKLAILSPDYLYHDKDTKVFIKEFYNRAGLGFRVYKNTLFVLTLDAGQFTGLKKTFKRYLALENIQKDKALIGQLTKESLDELRTKLKETERDLPFKILTAYRYMSIIGFMGSDEVSFHDLGIPTVGRSQTLTGRVKESLKDQERILSTVSPKYLLDKTFGAEEEEKPVQVIHDLFLKTPGMALLEDIDVLFNAIRTGAEGGLLGVQVDGRTYLDEAPPPLSLDVLVLKGDRARKLKAVERGKVSYAPPEEGRVEQPGIAEGPEITTPPSPVTGTKRIQSKAKVPWDKMAQIIGGVIRPLKDKGSEPEITIEIKAHSEAGFDRTTLDSKVKETLQQLGAQIEEWVEEW